MSTSRIGYSVRPSGDRETVDKSGDDTGPRPGSGQGPVDSAVERFDQRQRIDMTSPATMAPNPMAKFQAPRDTMKPIRSPAT